jgi:beta-glucanase (GH16 family)
VLFIKSNSNHKEGTNSNTVTKQFNTIITTMSRLTGTPRYLLLGVAAFHLSSHPIVVDGYTVGEKVWEEEFLGSALNTNVWAYDLGRGGWGNDELQEYTNQAVTVANGVLQITASGDATYGYLSGRINSLPGFKFKYGTLEARIKVPDLDAGLWPALWTMGENFPQVGWPAAGEIDIMEMGQGLAISEGVVNQRVVSASHWDLNGQYMYNADWKDALLELTDDYHIFKFEWDKFYLRTYVDENIIWQFDISDTSLGCADCSEFHQFHFLLLNLAVGGRFTYAGEDASSGAAADQKACSYSSGAACGVRTGTTAPMPATMEVDYIRLFANADTEIKVVTTPTAAPVVAPTLVQNVSPPPPSSSPIVTVNPPPPALAPIVTVNPPPPTFQPLEAGPGINGGSGGKAGKAGIGKAESGKGSVKAAGGGKAGAGKAGVGARVSSTSELSNVPSAASRYMPSMVVSIPCLVGILVCISSLF